MRADVDDLFGQFARPSKSVMAFTVSTNQCVAIVVVVAADDDLV